MALSARYLSLLPSELTDLFSQLESDIINDICRRIKKANYNMTATADWQIYKMQQMGYSQKEVQKLISKALNISDKMVRDIMTDACSYSVDNDNKIYRKAKEHGVNLASVYDLADTPNLKALLDAGIKQTQWELRNFTQTMAISSQAQFISALDNAWLQVKSGAIDPNTAIKNAVKKLGADGIKMIDYASGRRDQVDVATRRAALTGVNQTSGKISEQRMQDMGVNLVITTSHNGSRPEHQTWQGRVFAYDSVVDGYEDFRAATGYGTVSGCQGANCRHHFYPYYKGISRNTMQHFDSKENNNLYEAEQEQRKNERMIRQWKRRKDALDSVGLDSIMETSKVKEWQRKQREHIEKYGLPRQYHRERV